MTNPGPSRRIERRLVGEPIPVGERTIQPVARVTGWRGSKQGETGGGAGAWLRVTPVEVMVREGNGTEYRIPITDPTRETERRMVLAALLVAVLSWLLARLLHRRTRAGPL